MIVLVCYDVATEDAAGVRRLRRIAEACKDYGVRVQYSVFECRVEPARWVALRTRLLGEIDLQRDSVRFYFIRDNDATKTEHHGVRCPVDPSGPLVV